jgi:hypothetical protein
MRHHEWYNRSTQILLEITMEQSHGQRAYCEVVTM